MKARTIIAISTLVLLSLTGCVSNPEQDLANLPPAKDSHEAAQRIVQIAAGFCKGMAEKHGADFTACFKQQTDLAIKQIEAQEAAQVTPSK
ncbi:hypothetical protein ACTMQ1_26560 [Pseudomonas syringae pv. aptata]|uniref:hypothetical protein n=1 Tax=Pseudomonas syringae TaxID=317 RepID=UPI003F88C3E8